MMSCDKAKELLSDYLDGTLEPSVKKELDQFLEGDAECKKLFAEAKTIQEKLLHMPKIVPSDNFDANLRNRIINLNNTEKAPFINKKGLSLALSGTALVASLYMFIFTDIGSQQGVQEGPVPSSAIGTPNSFQQQNDVKDQLVTSEEDSLNTLPEKINTDNIHLTGDQHK